MDRLLRDPEFRDRMIIRGQRRIFQEHTYELRLRQVIDTLGLELSSATSVVSAS